MIRGQITRGGGWWDWWRKQHVVCCGGIVWCLGASDTTDEKQRSQGRSVRIGCQELTQFDVKRALKIPRKMFYC